MYVCIFIKLHITAQSGPVIRVYATRIDPPKGGSMILQSFNDWGGRGCRKFVPVLKGDGTKIAPSGDIFDQPPGEMS